MRLGTIVSIGASAVLGIGALLIARLWIPSHAPHPTQAAQAATTVVEASVWGKLKTSVQFLAILFAILRPGHRTGGLYADEWLMIAAALLTIASAVDYFARFSGALRGESVADR